ncbi:YchJ family protein [cf. Phormidesmis sp. LEGE 11477]|uniref:YchJ family protein n=1 Tax=cf. Phormidesmis sp. LEGE 11477 TaxID=1828680 RepID=UPI001880E921|nr:YchJ family metal-binding protein [cf. Phormidesmis sp. LEGE 11477]MBE9061414.1 SEC-C domain-containing protein [cf. Phormidesmis sp. LEGE 11477]
MSKQCPCGSRRPFANCCEPYLKGISKGTNAGIKYAPTAEALMRSRYTAFALGDIDYLLATHHIDYRSDAHTSLQQTIQTTQWLNLLVIDTQKGQRKDKTGTVEFVAAYRSKAPAKLSITLGNQKASATDSENSPLNDIGQLHEKSQFVREGPQWFYTQGDLLPPYQPKRTQPCWCGSRLKFKQCHGK